MEYLLIISTPLLLAIVGLAIVRFKKLSWREDVGFAPPSPKVALTWVAGFVVYAAAVELIGSADSAWGSWAGKYDGAQLAFRIGAVALVYPLLEEFFFRGVFLGVIRRRFGDVAAVIVPALVFALVHTQYDWPILIFIDGLIFGAARVSTRSVYVPMLMHVLGNSYAVWERLQ